MARDARLTCAHVDRACVILGAGFGGLELSTRLAEELADEVRVTLIDKSDSISVFGFSKLDVMFGRRTADEVRFVLPRHREAERPVPPGDGDVDRPRRPSSRHRHRAPTTPTSSSSRWEPTRPRRRHRGWPKAATSSTRPRAPPSHVTCSRRSSGVDRDRRPRRLLQVPAGAERGGVLLHDHAERRGVRDASRST